MNRNHVSRKGALSRLLILFLVSVLAVVGLSYVAIKIRPDSQQTFDPDSTVRIYCASGVAKPVADVVQRYNEAFGTNIKIVRTGGSGELAGQIKTEFESGIRLGADLYITADDSLLDKAIAEGMVAERFQVATQKPVIAVKARSPLEISDLKDLIDQEIKFGIASKRAAVGKAVREIADQSDLTKKLESRLATESENVMTLAQSLVAGSLEAAVIWDTTVAQINQTSPDRPLLEIAALADPLDATHSDIVVGVISTSDVATEALRFCRYLTSPEQGRAPFEQFGFSILPGDRWEARPEIHLYFGSMFTPVLEDAVREFGIREGVDIYPRWEGCGKLVAAMDSIVDPGLFPDAYLACDISFLNEVQSQFGPPATLSKNEIVMVVQKSLTLDISTPADVLGRKLRIGLCDPEQSALGSLTRRILTQEPYVGLYQKMVHSSVVTVDVGPTLISQLAAHGLDVAFVYRSNVLADSNARNELRIVEFDQRAAVTHATQPWAISKSTGNRQMMNRLYRWMHRPEILERFKENGFQLTDE